MNAHLLNSIFTSAFLFFMVHSIDAVWEPKCNLPNECELIKDYYGSQMIRCQLEKLPKFFPVSDGVLLEDVNDSCLVNNGTKARFILDVAKYSTFVLKNQFNFGLLLSYIVSLNPNNKLFIVFTEISGMETDLELDHIHALSSNNKTSPILSLELKSSTLDFYSSSKLVHSCRDLVVANRTEPKTLLQMALLLGNGTLELTHCRYPTKVCPLLFRNVHVREMTVWSMIKSTVLENQLSFDEDFNAVKFFGGKKRGLNCRIEKLVIKGADNLELTWKFMNREVFEEIKTLEVKGGQYFFQIYL